MAGEASGQALERDPQNLLERLFQSSPVVNILTDADGRTTDVNAQVERLFGYTRQELLGQTVEILIPERFRQNHRQLRTGYGDQPLMRPMGTGLELYGRRDGRAPCRHLGSGAS